MSPTPRLVVEGADPRGALLVAFDLPHGGDPGVGLRERGWDPVTVRSAEAGPPGSGVALTLRYAVQPAASSVAPPAPREPRAAAGPPRDAALAQRPGEVAHPHQRAAAYGVVRSHRGLLLTELSAATNAAGRWNLPGGGLDPGESPADALHREVWEETGQRIGEPRLIDIRTSHWVGRAPHGRLEDFHAVRIIFAAPCPSPREPVVHDVGGSTSAARWVPLPRLAEVPVVDSFRAHLAGWLAAAG